MLLTFAGFKELFGDLANYLGIAGRNYYAALVLALVLPASPIVHSQSVVEPLQGASTEQRAERGDLVGLELTTLLGELRLEGADNWVSNGVVFQAPSQPQTEGVIEPRSETRPNSKDRNFFENFSFDHTDLIVLLLGIAFGLVTRSDMFYVGYNPWFWLPKNLQPKYRLAREKERRAEYSAKYMAFWEAGDHEQAEILYRKEYPISRWVGVFKRLKNTFLQK